MFISARTERIPVTRSITQPISASAAASEKSELGDHGDSTSSVSRRPVTAHSSSVMKGMKGCSSFRIWSRAQAAVARVSAFGTLVAPLEHRLGDLDIPVAENVIDKVIGGIGGVVEAIGLDRCRRHRATALAVSATIHWLRYPCAGAGSKPSGGDAVIHLAEAAGVPQLGGEVAAGLDPRGADSACRGSGRAPAPSVKRSASAPNSSINAEGIDHVALGLGHLRALLVEDATVDVDGLERHLPHEVEAHHHHAGDPEEDDVEAGDEHVGRIVAASAPASCPASPASRTATAPTRTRCRARPRRA